MKAATVVFLVVLAANAQTTQRSASHRAAPGPAPQRMSHDFRTAGRRAVTAIGDLGRVCGSGTPACGVSDQLEFEGKASKAIEEADAQHDNPIDKQAVELLKEYNRATFDAALDQAQAALSIQRSAWCNAGACDAMYTTCKKEAEDAFESGVLPAKSQCKSLSPRDPNKD